MCVKPELIPGEKLKKFLHLAGHGACCRFGVEVSRQLVHGFGEAIGVVFVDAFEGELWSSERNRMDFDLLMARFGTLLWLSFVAP